MTLEKAIKILKANYEKAKLLSYVRNPITWALYRTWEDAAKEMKK